VNKEYTDILIAVAHPSEEEAVRKAAAIACCRCEIIVTGVGGAAMSWALQKRFAIAAVPCTKTVGIRGSEAGSGAMTAARLLPQKEPGQGRGDALSPDSEHASATYDAGSRTSREEGAGATLPSLVIGTGIAGSYVESLPPGSVVVAESDCFADMGIDDNGHFIPLFGAGLAEPDVPPFSGGRIRCSGRWFDLASGIMPAVKAATVNMTSGSPAVIERIRSVWNPEIETMEGAWLAYTCTLSGIPWLSVRAVSNRVEPRNPRNWNIPLALRNLQDKMTNLLELIAKS